MALGDYFKGPEHKADAVRLEAELQAHRQQSQADMQALQTRYDDLEAKALKHLQRSRADMQELQTKYDDLEAKAREIGLLDLLAVQEQIRAEESRLVSLSGILCARHSMTNRSMYAYQQEDDEGGLGRSGSDAVDPQGAH